MITKTLTSSQIETPLGSMLAIADENTLYVLMFAATKEHELASLQKKLHARIIPGSSEPLRSIEAELHNYFKNRLQEFTTPYCLLGSPFQQRTWQEIAQTSYSTTRSYADIASAIGKPQAYRAVAQAAGANPCALIVPCHRVINTDGNLGGYNGGIARKEWLLNHEKKQCQDS